MSTLGDSGLGASGSSSVSKYIPVVNPPPAVRNGLQLCALPLQVPKIRNLLRLLFFGNLTNKQLKDYFMDLVHAYEDQQPKQIKLVIQGWRDGSAGKDTGYRCIKFALLHALEDITGTQINGSKGIKEHHYTADMYLDVFKDHRPLRESSLWSSAWQG